MTDTPIDTAAAGTEPALDREALLASTMRALTRLEKMYEAKLRTAKNRNSPEIPNQKPREIHRRLG